MIESPKAGTTVWFLHGGKPMAGTVMTEKTIDGFYSVAVSAGIPKLLSPDELFETKEDLACCIRPVTPTVNSTESLISVSVSKRPKMTS